MKSDLMEINFLDTVKYVNTKEQTYKEKGADLNIHFVRNISIEGIEPYIKYHHYQNDLKLGLTFGDFDNLYQEFLEPSATIKSQKPDVIVLSLKIENLFKDFNTFNWQEDQALTTLKELFDMAAANSQGLIVVNTFLPMFYSKINYSGNTILAKKKQAVARLNAFITTYVSENAARFFLADWDRFASILSYSKSLDHRFWYTSQAPFKKDFLNLYAFEITGIAKTLMGRLKKCLILDCDNTMWGGVLGEDGLNGIQLDPHEYPGKVFLDFQKSVMHLHESGVLLAICSKNNEADVLDALENHPHMLIKKQHLIGYKINWDNKAQSIAQLAEELNLGLDSFVFIDDSPTECELVRSMLPAVTVLQVPKKITEYPSLPFSDALFYSTSASKEDKNRTQMYQSEFNRKIESNKFNNIDDYLTSLNIEVDIHRIEEGEIPRVTQLTQRTNQFNFTTKRYQESQIKEMTGSKLWEIMTLTANDKFGDMGLTGVVIAQRNENKILLDTFLMSCRILGRKIEYAFIKEMVTRLKEKWTLKTLETYYIPTQKNQQLANFWSDLGFLQDSEGTDEPNKTYELSIDKIELPPTEHIKVLR